MKKNYDDMTVRELWRELKDLDKFVEDFYNDPITQELGVPTGDFQEDFDRKERHILMAISKKSKVGSADMQKACDRMEKFFP